MAFVKVGYHGSAPGIGDYMKLLDEAVPPVPFILKSVNNAGFAAEAARYTRDSSVPNVVVMRWTNPGGGPEVPDYRKPPAEAAVEHWELVRQSIAEAPELHEFKDYLWLETINEPRTQYDFNDPNFDNMHPVDWLGWFAHHVGELSMADGWQWSAFGMNAGTPEKEDWKLPGMKQYLRDCETYSEWLSVALHEYTLDSGSDFESKYPFLIGRFTWLFEACDEMDIARPKVLITEAGWGHDDMVSLSLAMDDIRWYSELIAQYPTLLGAQLWNLYEPQQLSNKLQQTIGPVTTLALSTVYPDPDPPPVGCSPSGEPREQYTRVYWVVNPSAANQEQVLEVYRQAAEAGMTVGPSYDDAGLGALEDKTAVLFGIAPEQEQVFIDWYEEHYPCTKVEFRELPTTEPGNPLEGLELGAPFRVPFVLVQPGGVFNAPRDYANGLHEGVDYDILTGAIDSDEPVLALYPGVIVSSRRSDGYGERVVQECEYNGELFYLWYAHMDKRFVVEGDVVAQGQHLGEIGSTGNSTGEHLHITMQHDGTGLDGYVVDNVVDPTDLISMEPVDEEEDEYIGPPVTYSSSLHGPGSDWMWQLGEVTKTLSEVGLPVKYMTNGSNRDFWGLFDYSIVRIFWQPNEPKTPLQAWEDVGGDTLHMYQMGARKFELFNEPNLPQEGFGVVWDSGEEFGIWLEEFIQIMKANCPEAQLYYPGLSPGVPWTNQFEFTNAAWPYVGGEVYGFCMHTYTGITDDVEAAAEEMYQQVIQTQAHISWRHPILVSECSVNRGDDNLSDEELYRYKAAVYYELEKKLALVPGIEACVWYISKWDPPSEQAGHKENWVGTNLPDEYLMLRNGA